MVNPSIPPRGRSSRTARNDPPKESSSSKDPVTYPTLPPHLSEYMATDSVLNRRQSLPPKGAPQGVEAAGTPWDIVNTEQLQEWAKQEPDQFLDILNELRQQRDLGIEALEVLEDAQKNDVYHGMYLKLQTANLILTDRNKEIAEQLLELEAKVRSFREGTPSDRSQSTKRSPRVPDPPCLTDGQDPTWEDWSSKIGFKLEINHDHFENERMKLVYVLSRTAGKAFEHTYCRSQKNSDDPFSTADEVLKDLSESFEDPDKYENYRREFVKLNQGVKKFSDFYAEFKRLASYLGYNEKQLLAELKDKMAPRLRSALAALEPQLTQLPPTKNYCIRVDNEHRAMREAKDKLEASTKVTKRVAFSNLPPSSPRSPVPLRRSSPSNEQRTTDEQEGNCFTCHQKGHSTADCPKRVILTSPSYVPPFRRSPQANELSVDDFDRALPSDTDSEN